MSWDLHNNLRKIATRITIVLCYKSLQTCHKHVTLENMANVLTAGIRIDRDENLEFSRRKHKLTCRKLVLRKQLVNGSCALATYPLTVNAYNLAPPLTVIQNAQTEKITIKFCVFFSPQHNYARQLTAIMNHCC